MPKNGQGCKKQLVIDAIISEDANRMKHNLFTAYIDYKRRSLAYYIYMAHRKSEPIEDQSTNHTYNAGFYVPK